MASSATEHLALVNSVITRRLNGDGYDAYTVGERRWAGMPLKDLYEIRDRLANEVAADGAASHYLAEPVEF